jgi:hypothetical protein
MFATNRFQRWSLIWGLIFALSMPALGQSSTLKLKETNKLEANGDASFSYELKFPTAIYTKLKANTPNTALMMRKLGINNDMKIVEETKGSWDDGENTLKLDFKVLGYARMAKDLRWEAELLDAANDTELVAVTEGVAVMTQAASVPGFGLATNTIRYKMPDGATDVKVLKSPNRISYKLPLPKEQAGEAKIDINVDTKDQVMSSLAKALSNRKFGPLWTARARLKNTGTTTLKDYRIRFRIADYTASWSPWQATPAIVPGQTVLDAYFPILDMEKVNKLTGQTKVSMEVQWQYKGADGKVVEDSETKEFTLLSRNQVYYSSMKQDEIVDFYDRFNLVSAVLSSFVTHEDPVIQQAAGRVAKWAGGSNAAGSDEEALKYMKAVYLLMSENIAYQTPPAGDNDTKFLQHVKYGREVLKNKAGTCIDLAILYGSMCQAVGLDAVIYSIPGHAFPAVKLPISGRIIPIESTMIGNKSFEDANKYAVKEHFGGINAGQIPNYEVIIKDAQKLGALPIDLPNVGEDPLEKWGIKMPGTNPTPAPAPNGGEAPAPMANRQPILGVWKMSVNAPLNGVPVSCQQVIEFKADGTFQAVARINVNGQQSDTEDTGTWSMRGETLTIEGNDTGRVVRKVKFAEDGNSCTIFMKEFGMDVKFTKVKK